MIELPNNEPIELDIKGFELRKLPLACLKCLALGTLFAVGARFLIHSSKEMTMWFGVFLFADAMVISLLIAVLKIRSKDNALYLILYATLISIAVGFFGTNYLFGIIYKGV